MTKLQKAIRKTIHTCLKLNSDESLLILIDESNRELGYLLLKTALRVTEKVFLVETKRSHKDHDEPLPFIVSLMTQIKATIIATSNSFYHSKALQTACHHGARILCLSKLTPEIVERCINTNFEFITEKSKRLADLLSIGKSVRLITLAGTNITIPITRRKGVADTGMVHEAGIFAALPAGEAWIPPLPGKANGTIVVDGSLGPLGLIHKPIVLKIKNGYIKQIIGATEALYLRKILKSFGKMARNLAELGIGTNPQAVLTGKSIEDEKVQGTVHIAMGNSAFEGGSYHKHCHIDAIIKNPTLEIDERLIIKEGKLLV